MEMEQNTPQIVGKKLWNIVRIVLYMVRNGMSRSNLMLDLQIALQIMLKRWKLAGKAITDLMLHHGNGGGSHNSVAARLTCRSDDAVVSSFVRPLEYEFSCSNSPAAASSKRRKRSQRKNRHEWADGRMVSFQKALEILDNSGHGMAAVPEASPEVALPGFGRSPRVRRLRVTDSPFPLKENSEGSSQIDKDAEEFINKFYRDLKKQRRTAALEPPSPFHIWAH